MLKLIPFTIFIPWRVSSSFKATVLAVASIVILTTTRCTNIDASTAEPKATQSSERPVIVFETTKGTLVAELFPLRAPKSCALILQAIRDGYYDGTLFHRVIAGFVIQGGRYDPDLEERSPLHTVELESNNGLKNLRGSLAIARGPEPDSGSAEFYINLADNPYLDYHAPEKRSLGYAVFGRLLEGFDVLDSIAQADLLCPSGDSKVCAAPEIGSLRDVPIEPVQITKAYLRSTP